MSGRTKPARGIAGRPDRYRPKSANRAGGIAFDHGGVGDLSGGRAACGSTAHVEGGVTSRPAAVSSARSIDLMVNAISAAALSNSVTEPVLDLRGTDHDAVGLGPDAFVPR